MNGWIIEKLLWLKTLINTLLKFMHSMEARICTTIALLHRLRRRTKNKENGNVTIVEGINPVI